MAKATSSFNPKLDQRTLGMRFRSAREWVARLAQSTYLEHELDYYNQGELISLLEQRVASLLNKPAALFFTKGMIAQFSLLKAVEAGCDSHCIALHPLSHLALDEGNAYQHVLHLEAIKVGSPKAPIQLSELVSIQEPLAALCLELPLRRAGFKLPSLSELTAQSDWASAQATHRHMDGARLWEAAAYYEKSPAELSALFDSVYVSLYKGLGAMGGAVLAGDEALIADCRLWQHRFGGQAFTAFPFVVSALDGLDEQLTLIPAWLDRAKQLASVLAELPELTVDTPQSNAFFVYLEGDQSELNERARALSEKFKMSLFNSVNRFPKSEELFVEIQVGEQHDSISDDEVINYFKALVA